MAPGLWLRWSIRDLRARWPLVVALGLTIALGTGAYAGLTSTSTWARMSYDESYARTAMADIHVALPAGSLLPSGTLRDRVTAVLGPDVAHIEERLVLPTQVDASVAEQTVLVPGALIGVDVADDGPHVDRLSIRAGRGFASNDDGADRAILEWKFGRAHGLPVGQTVTVSGGHGLTVVGQALAPEYFLVQTPAGGLLAEAGYAVVFVPLATAERIAGASVANDVLVELATGVDPTIARDRIAADLADGTPAIAAATLLASEDDVHETLYHDIESDAVFFRVFALLLLAGAALAAFNLTSRVVDAQRREIGIAMALGTRPSLIAIRPLLLSAEIALLGVVLGVLVGLAFGEALRRVYVDLIPLPIWLTPFQVPAFATAAALGFLIPFLATLQPVLRAIRVPPVEAIRTGHLAGRESSRPHERVLAVARRATTAGSLVARMPLRNVVRTPRRTLLTALGIAAAAAVVVATGATIDTLNRTISIGEAELLRGSPRRTSVALDGFRPAASILADVRAVPAVDGVATGITLPAVASAAGVDLDLSIDLIDLASGPWTPSVSAGNPPADGDGILLAERAARDLGIAPGDTIELRHPVLADASGTLAERTDRIVVRGLHSIPLRSSAYADRALGDAWGFAGLTNALTVVPAPNAADDDVARALFDVPGVASVQTIAAIVGVFRDIVDEYLAILAVAQLTALALAIAIALNASTIGFDERRREHATMLAFGLPVRSIVVVGIVELAIIGALGTLLGIAVGRGLLQWLFETILPTTFPDIGFRLDLSGATIIGAVIAGVLAVALAPTLGARRLARLDLPTTLRVVE